MARPVLLCIADDVLIHERRDQAIALCAIGERAGLEVRLAVHDAGAGSHPRLPDPFLASTQPLELISGLRSTFGGSNPRPEFLVTMGPRADAISSWVPKPKRSHLSVQRSFEALPTWAAWSWRLRAPRPDAWLVSQPALQEGLSQRSWQHASRVRLGRLPLADSAARTEAKPRGSSPTLLAIESAAGSRALPRLREAMVILRRYVPEASLIWASSNAFPPSTMAEENAAAGIEFVRTDDLDQVWPRVAMVVAAEEDAAFPIVIEEAWERGLPAIANRFPGAEFLAQASSGSALQLATAGPASFLADAIDQVLSDPDLRQGLITAGHERSAALSAGRFDFDAWFDLQPHSQAHSTSG